MTVKPLLDAFRDYISLQDDPVTQEWFDGFNWNMPERSLLPKAVPAMHELPEYSSELGPPITKAPFFGAQFEQTEQIPFVSICGVGFPSEKLFASYSPALAFDALVIFAIICRPKAPCTGVAHGVRQVLLCAVSKCRACHPRNHYF